MKNLIKQLRAEAGMSQAQLASIVGVSRQSINSIETGKYIPSLSLAFELSRFFKRPVEELFEYEESDAQK